MWKQIVDLVSGLATIMYRLERQEKLMNDLQNEVKGLTAIVQKLMFELHQGQEREKYEREKFQLRIENELLKSGRQLPQNLRIPKNRRTFLHHPLVSGSGLVQQNLLA
jgi:hypothetical protein